MEKYIIIVIDPQSDSVEFDIRDIEAEEGTHEFDDILEEYQTNWNSVFCVRATEENSKQVQNLAEKLKT